MWHEWSPIKKLIWLRKFAVGVSYILKTVTGAIVHIIDAVVGPVEALSVAVEPVQNLNGYDNPWPAGGMGNLLPLTVTDSQSSNGITVKVENGVITVSGTATANTVLYFSLDEPIDIDPTIYKIALFNDKAVANCAFVTRNQSANLHNFSLTAVNRIVADWTAQPSEVTYSVGVSVLNGVTANVTLKPFVFPYASTVPTTFYPYSNICPITGWDEVKVNVSPTQDAQDGTTYTIQLGQTVYGGTLDVVNGKMTVDRAFAQLNDPDKWSAYEGTVNFRYDNNFSNRKMYSNSYTGLLCSYIGVVPNGNETARWVGANLGYFGIKSSALTIDQVKSDALAGKISICYPLATPFELALTPQQISTLQGTNNVWSDAGDVTVDFAADLKTYIDNKIAAAVAALS